MPDPVPLRPKQAPARLWPPVATALICMALGAVYLWQSALDAYGDMALVHGYGVIPAELFGLRLRAPQIGGPPAPVTLLTAQFLHGGGMHLFGNLLAVALAGVLVERRTGPIRMILVFVVAGIIGLAVEAAAEPSSTAPIIGASAGAAGLIGGVLRRDPLGRIRLPLPGRGGLRMREIPALPLIGCWLIAQVAGIAFASGAPVAFLAHGSGFVAGVLLAGRRGGPT